MSGTDCQPVIELRFEILVLKEQLNVHLASVHWIRATVQAGAAKDTDDAVPREVPGGRTT